MKYYVVLDTNVVVSALFNISSVPGIILQEALAGRVIPLLHEDTALYRASYRLHDTTNLHVGDSEFLLPVTLGQAGSAPAESSIEFRFFRICLALLRVSTQIVKEQSAQNRGTACRWG